MVAVATARRTRSGRTVPRPDKSILARYAQGRTQTDESGDDLIPPMPIGRLIAKGKVAGLEYDPLDAPEFVADEFGSGEFSWEPLTPEGGLVDESEGYLEESIPVPSDRLGYLRAAGYLTAPPEADCRFYFNDEVFVNNDREWQYVAVRGNKIDVEQSVLRLMQGIVHRRPWEVDDTSKLTGSPTMPELPLSAAAE